MIRNLAIQTIMRWEKEGTYLTRMLQKVVPEETTPRDRALLTELVYGPVRWRGTLDSILMAYAPRGIDQIKPRLLEILRQAVYQMVFLDRIHHGAIVNESVNLATEWYPKKVTGFVNGLLRGISRGIVKDGADGSSSNEPESSTSIEVRPGHVIRFDKGVFPDSSASLDAHLAARYSHPKWLVARWVKNFGVEQATEILRANCRTPSLTLRVNRLKTDAEALAIAFMQAGIDSQPGALPYSICLDHVGRVESLPGYSQGHFQVQDISSQTAAHLLDPAPEEVVLDLCAAPGGKSTHLAELMLGRGKIVSLDISEPRTHRIRENAERLGLTNIEVRIGDASTIPDEENERYDRVLVDAPCSNTGAFARRPEARWRIVRADLSELHEIQVAILNRAVDLLKKGGRLVYSTCSIEPEENQQVVQKTLAKRDELRQTDEKIMLPSSDCDGGYFATLVHE